MLENQLLINYRLIRKLAYTMCLSKKKKKLNANAFKLYTHQSQPPKTSSGPILLIISVMNSL